MTLSRKKWAILSAFLSVSSVLSAPPVSDSNSLIITTEVPKEISPSEEKQEPKAPVVPKIYQMNVNTTVSNRFAKTTVASKVKNSDDKANEATFSVVLPETAFISGFVMEIDGKSYEAYVKEKEEAKKIYDNAVSSGLGAAHVAVSARDSNRFTISVNIEPQSKATFYLKYEELLQRLNERYEIVLNMHPGQLVKDLTVEVQINETRPLKFVKAPSLRSGNEITKNDEKLDPKAQIKQENSTYAVVKFNPDLDRQKQLAKELGTKEENGLAGQFIVQYDVERDPKGGEVLVDDGYFVHFFAPSDLPSLPKLIVFVLDTSGSMDGTRIKQLKEAMNSIISELEAKDSFHIVEFSSVVKVWNVDRIVVQYQRGEDPWASSIYPGDAGFNQSNNETKTEQVMPSAFPATEEAKANGRKVVEQLMAYGGTDIQSALEVGLELIQKSKSDKTNKQQPIMVFLTDGEPTVGETYTTKIISKVTELNGLKVPIFSLSFGDGADRDFLQKISLKNQGFARHIYEAADASLQLEEFYHQISSPLLSNVTFKYVSETTEPKTTKRVFPILFRGSELVVAGEADKDFRPGVVECWGTGDDVLVFKPEKVQRPVSSLERLWAYLSIKQILEARDIVQGDNKTAYTKAALDKALKYSFVTPVSSLVVVKPNDTKADTNLEPSNPNPDIPTFSYANAAHAPIQPLILSGAPQPVNFQGFNTQEESSIDRFAGGDDIVLMMVLPTTEVATITPSPLEQLKLNLPWLGSILNENSTTINLANKGLPGGSYGFAASSGLGNNRNGVQYYTTTFAPPTTPKFSTLEVLKQNLPWLESVLQPNETITLSTGNFNLGLTKTVTDRVKCPITPNNSTEGICALLQSCPQVHANLRDVKVYEKYFCKLEGFAGVCCPV